MRTLFIVAALFSSLARIFGASDPSPKYKTVQIYDDLRSQALALGPDLVGAEKDDEVFAVLMETGYPEAVATLIATLDGSASLYYSNGGGTIGAGGHAGPNAASKALVRKAPTFLKHMAKTESRSLPREGFTRFYLVTRSGLLTAEVKEEDLGEDRHALSPLFYAGHDLISAIIAIDQKTEANKTPEGTP